MVHSKEQNKWTEMIPEDVKISVLGDKGFKTTVLSMFKELQENLDKEPHVVRKMTHGQNEDNRRNHKNKQTNKNSGAEDYNTRSEIFTIRV